MRESLPLPPEPTRLPALYFEYGADEARCQQGVEISERGMCFDSRWRFSAATTVGVSVSFNDRSGVPRRLNTEGIVVGCDSTGVGRYRVTLLFLDLEDCAKPAIRDLSCLLALNPRNQAPMGTCTAWR